MALWEQGLRLLLAVIIGCVIGIERERKNRPAGMRTHVLVCVGASIIAIMENLMIADTIALNLNCFLPASKLCSCIILHCHFFATHKRMP